MGIKAHDTPSTKRRSRAQAQEQQRTNGGDRQQTCELKTRQVKYQVVSDWRRRVILTKPARYKLRSRFSRLRSDWAAAQAM